MFLSTKKRLVSAGQISAEVAELLVVVSEALLKKDAYQTKYKLGTVARDLEKKKSELRVLEEERDAARALQIIKNRKSECPLDKILDYPFKDSITIGKVCLQLAGLSSMNPNDIDKYCRLIPGAARLAMRNPLFTGYKIASIRMDSTVPQNEAQWSYENITRLVTLTNLARIAAENDEDPAFFLNTRLSGRARTPLQAWDSQPRAVESYFRGHTWGDPVLLEKYLLQSFGPCDTDTPYLLHKYNYRKRDIKIIEQRTP